MKNTSHLTLHVSEPQPIASSIGLRNRWDGTHAKRLLFAGLLAWASIPTGLAARDSWTAPEQVATLPNQAPATKEAIEHGKALYLDRCVDCHGKKGRGDGPGAADLEVRPPDFSKPHVRAQTDAALFWKLTEGRRPMPGYGSKLSEEQRWQLVAYLRSLPAR